MKTIITAVLFLFSGAVVADNLVLREDTKKLSDKMIGHFVKGNFSEGLSLAKPYWPLPAVEIDGLANQISTQWPMIDTRFGKATGSEFVREERIGESFTRYYYLHKFANHAIYWQITFYKPEKTWKVNGVTFMDNLNILFESVE